MGDTRRMAGFVVTAMGLLLAACGDSDEPRTLAVLSAFPAELSALVERADVAGTTTVDGRIYRTGTLSGIHVVLAMTGIGMSRATAATQALLDHFDVSGVVFSGVAGSRLYIGDVAVPQTWMLGDGTSYPADPGWLDLARSVAQPGGASLERCTPIPTDPATEVCLPHDPVVVVGGVGRSEGESPLRCLPGGDDVFGCDLGGGPAQPLGFEQPAEPDPPDAIDMETAACAREASARGLPFIAFRGVSDGQGDPLGQPGFPGQFFTYYRLAAHNAAATTAPFLARVAETWR